MGLLSRIVKGMVSLSAGLRRFFLLEKAVLCRPSHHHEGDRPHHGHGPGFDAAQAGRGPGADPAGGRVSARPAPVWSNA